MSVWADKNEDNVLDCIEEACRNSNELVENFHKKDRVHENGVDISCENLGKKINFQAKVKPGKEHIEQLERFSESVADERIYVYVDQPSRPFKKSMDKLNGVVDFWDAKKLDEFLISNRSQLYIRYMFLNTTLARDIHDALFKIFSCSNVNPTPLESPILDYWWDFKDRATKLHANLELIELFWKDRLLSQDKHSSIVLKGLLDEIFLGFAIIAKTCSKGLLDVITRIAKQQPSVLSYYVIKVLKSTPWGGMVCMKGETECSVKEKSIIHEWMLPTKGSGSEYSLISNYLGDFHNIGQNIEAGVDYVFSARQNREAT